MEKIFVYGTLKTGKGKASYITGELWDLTAFPAVLLNGEGSVKGEIIEVDEPTLSDLDMYEGVSAGLYRRERVTTASGEEVWVYVFNRPLPKYAKRLYNGEWNKKGR